MDEEDIIKLIYETQKLIYKKQKNIVFINKYLKYVESKQIDNSILTLSLDKLKLLNSISSDDIKFYEDELNNM